MVGRMVGIPANTRCSPNVGLMVARRLRRRPTNNPTWVNVSWLLGLASRPGVFFHHKWDFQAIKVIRNVKMLIILTNPIITTKVVFSFCFLFDQITVIRNELNV